DELYIPLTYTVWWGLVQVASEPTVGGVSIDPTVFHAANVVLHAASAVAVFWLLRRLVANDWAACAGAALFALHPVQVESVAWISGLKDVLSGLLCIIALDQYVAFAQRRTPAARLHYLACALAFAAAMLAKPAAVVLPAMALLIDWLALRRAPRAVLRSIIPLAILAIPCVIWTSAAQPTNLVTTKLPAMYRPLVALDALSFYLAKLFVPIRLSIDYGRSPIFAIHYGWLWWTWVFPVALAVVLLRLANRLPLIVCGAALFVAALLPVLGLRPFGFQRVSTVADHYMYLPMLGVSLALAATMARCTRWFAAIAVLALIALAWRARDQASIWSTNRGPYEQALRVNPRSYLACNNLAAVALGEQRPEEAERLARRAMEVGSAFPEIHMMLGIALDRQRKVEQAIESFERGIALDPNDAEAHTLLGAAYGKLGRYDRAVEHLQTALRIDPNHAGARRMLPAAIQRRDARPSG
ncbi:MAG: tetratricopeptide repeat protein, partial [Tepidisphaeraceae bacterium]